MGLANIQRPPDAPFLDAINWQQAKLGDLKEEDIVALYERNWRFLGVLADPSADEWDYIRKLGERHQSWIARK